MRLLASNHRTKKYNQDWEARLGQGCLILNSTCEGYVQAVDGDGLLEIAREKNIILHLRSRPGDFITVGSPLAEIWPADDHSSEGISEEDLTEPLNETLITGIRRTPRQDVECAVDELVEVAVRSLSPGINDPFTAINCIDHLSAALGRLAERELPSAYRCDENNQLRIITHPVTFPNVLDAAFNQIRQYGRDSVAVTIRLLEALASVAAHVVREEDKVAIRLHGKMIAQNADSAPQEHDRQAIRERFDLLMEELDAMSKR